METLVIKIKSNKAAQALADFLKTIDYVETVTDVTDEKVVPHPGFQEGTFAASEKPSDFAGIWKNRKKVDAQKLRNKAWQRKRK